MDLDKYLSNVKTDLRARTICFLVKDSKILLGLKKDGIGEGNYVGIGGKQEEGETVEETLKREMTEEIKIEPLKYRNLAVLDFYFIERRDWNQRVYVYLCDKWEGEISKSEEITPQWFNISQIPYHKMWEDAQYYLPFITKNKEVKGKFLYNSSDRVVDCKLRITCPAF